MTMLLEDKVALVTGAGSGIGRSIALAYAREGAKVLIADVDPAAGQETMTLVERGGGQAAFHLLDVAQPDQHFAAVDDAMHRWGSLHIACNNAGIIRGQQSGNLLLADVAPEHWAQVLAVNLSGVFFGLRAQIPALVASGGGGIVNIASIASQVAHAPGFAAYVSSKHGVLGLTRSAAVDYGEQGVRVNAVAPGFIRTPMTAWRGEDNLRDLGAQQLLKRLGAPEEVAELVVWLSSDRASFVTGGFYPADGGYLAT
ncbi:SDR family oxidoreductase [Variovorax ureilyticus]|uniref:SDR family oxidoreductase n=1 Tax=Variovorax ureilyticus TaxID=1836198 RepID=A0ABU8VLV4_9BURK